MDGEKKPMDPERLAITRRTVELDCAENDPGALRLRDMLRELLAAHDYHEQRAGGIVNLPNFKARVAHAVCPSHGAARPIWCWGRTVGGHPRHPLMLSYSTPLEVFA